MAYRIGTSLATLTDLETLGVPYPHSYPMSYSARFDNAAGGYADKGWLQQEWRWGFITLSQRNVLRSYSGSVVICTRANDGTWKVYSGVMVWPQEEPENYADVITDFVVQFRNLVYICEEGAL